MTEGLCYPASGVLSTGDRLPQSAFPTGRRSALEPALEVVLEGHHRAVAAAGGLGPL